MRHSVVARLATLAVVVAATAGAQVTPLPGPIGPSRGAALPPGRVPVVAPGTVPLRPEVVKPSEPTLWKFAELKAEATAPTVARVAWRSRDDATHYLVYRDGVMISEVAASSAGSYAFLDEALTPGKNAKYHVEAHARRAMAQRAPKPGTLPAPAANTVTFTLLEKSQTASVATPAIDPPRDFRLTVTDPKARNVRVEWSKPAWATGFQIVRDGLVVANLPGTATSFDDMNLAAGAHTWSARSSFIAAPGKPTLTGTATVDLALRLQPLLVLAFGDSIMWGQGLVESSKFTTLTRDALRASTGVDVELISFAHSGAILRNTTEPLPAIGKVEGTGFDQARLITPGEVPNSFPTIFHQLNTLGPARVNGADVDLVIVNGCINDIGAGTIVDPFGSSSAIATLTQAKCGAMTDVLRRARALYPNATLVVTGYYPLISNMTLNPGAYVAAVQGKPAPKGNLLAGAAANSVVFRDTSDRVLGAAVATVASEDGPTKPNRAVFAPAPYQPQNAFGTPASFLWPIPSASNPDDVFSVRGASCQNLQIVGLSIGFPVYAPTDSELAGAKVKCPIASMGHPNRAGAQAYANAITTAIGASLPRWRDRYARSRR